MRGLSSGVLGSNVANVAHARQPRTTLILARRFDGEQPGARSEERARTPRARLSRAQRGLCARALLGARGSVAAAGEKMLLQRVGLENIKCFGASTEVDFTHGRADGTPHKWVVLYGDNGTGKSTFLKSCALAMTGQPALNALLSSADGWVRGSQRFGNVTAVFTKSPQDRSIGQPRARPIGVRWTLVGGRSTTIDKRMWPAGSIFLWEGRSKAEKDDAKLLQAQIASDESGRGWMVCGYGPHRRLSGAASEISEQIPPDGRAGRLVTLFHEKAALTSSERWLRDLHHRASLPGANQGTLDAIRRLLDEGLLPESVKLADITPDGVYFKTPYKDRVHIGDLSDGYRTVLSLAFDLLRHIAYCFDISDFIEVSGSLTRVTAEGVVLIDEIDSHLHPSWQRTIGQWLHSRFPNIQFIVATHSPLIATRVAADQGLVVRLVPRTAGRSRYVGAEVTPGRIGLTADQNLTGPNFGLQSTRDPLVESLLAEISELRGRVKRHRTAPDAEKLKQLEIQFQELAPAADAYQGIDDWVANEKELLAFTAKLEAKK